MTTYLTGDFLAAASAESRDAHQTGEEELGATNRGIRGHVLGHTGGVSDLAVELVLIDTVRGGRLADVAGAASEHQLIGNAILLGIEQVGAMRMG